jgi:hypothetical protein
VRIEKKRLACNGLPPCGLAGMSAMFPALTAPGFQGELRLALGRSRSQRSRD